MRRQVEYHLAQARADASAQAPRRRARRPWPPRRTRWRARCVRLHAERGVTIDVAVARRPAIVRVEREDLDEMLGNLLDNACKWARTRAVLSAASAGDRVAVTIDDDGPGIAPALREAVFERGVRADEAAPGSGLGLSIGATSRAPAAARSRSPTPRLAASASASTARQRSLIAHQRTGAGRVRTPRRAQRRATNGEDGVGAIVPSTREGGSANSRTHAQRPARGRA